MATYKVTNATGDLLWMYAYENPTDRDGFSLTDYIHTETDEPMPPIDPSDWWRITVGGFFDRFGVGPMTYLRQVRLRQVHDALRKASPGSCKVGDMAARWGFFHGSAFAHAYRKMFGELPSATLAMRDSAPGRRAAVA